MAVQIDLDNVVASLVGRSLRGAKTARLNVGFTAPYAVYVHEDLSANHPNGGQAKYLEQPMRRMQRRMAATVAKAIRQKKGLLNGLMESGDDLMAASRPLVPVDTGFLVNSGFVSVTTE